jgi:hypothetical protein
MLVAVMPTFFSASVLFLWRPAGFSVEMAGTEGGVAVSAAVTSSIAAAKLQVQLFSQIAS